MRDITPTDIARGRRLKTGAIAAPVLLTLVPAAVTLLLVFLAASGPPAAAVIFFVGMIATLIGLVAGLVTSAVLIHSRSGWKKEMRNIIAADGIKANEIEWFTNELRAQEKRVLAAVEARDLLLGDAYRETLASRLTASRIIKSSQRELAQARNRKSSLGRLQPERRGEFAQQINDDIATISRIGQSAKAMLGEAETRLQMIEAASTRGGTLADSELALKKLSARAFEVPLALESAKLAEEIRLEMEKDADDSWNEKAAI